MHSQYVPVLTLSIWLAKLYLLQDISLIIHRSYLSAQFLLYLDIKPHLTYIKFTSNVDNSNISILDERLRYQKYDRP